MIAMDMLSLLTCKACLCYSMIGLHLVRWLQGLGRSCNCLGDDGIAVDGVLHLGSPPNIFRRMISIGCADQWENYVRSAIKSQLQCLDVVVRRVLVDPIPHGFTPAMDHQAHIDPPIPEPYMDVEIALMVPDA